MHLLSNIVFIIPFAFHLLLFMKLIIESLHIFKRGCNTTKIYITCHTLIVIHDSLSRFTRLRVFVLYLSFSFQTNMDTMHV